MEIMLWTFLMKTNAKPFVSISILNISECLRQGWNYIP